MKKNNILAAAHKLYREERYTEALAKYQEAASRLGPDIVQANIKLCKKRISLLSSHEALKRYTEQQSLIASRRDLLSFKRIGKRVLTKGESISFSHEITPGASLAFRIKCWSEEPPNPKGAVASITFFDNNRNLIPKPYEGYAKSKLYQSYFYVHTGHGETSAPSFYSITYPANAKYLEIELTAFSTDSLHLHTDGKAILSDHSINKSIEWESDYSECLQAILHEASRIPLSNGSEFFRPHNYNVGFIGDIYMFNYYKDSFTSVSYLSPDNYRTILSSRIDIIIYTTCWKGKDNEEWRGVKFREKPMNALNSIIEIANQKGIKTVFQSIEDPSNFDYFLPIAKKFNYVFTTDADCIERYKQELGHDNVYYGEYGVNPLLHNPIGSRRNIRNAAFFAGSYPKRYTERCRDMMIILDSILDANADLIIADRNFWTKSDDTSYPIKYQPSIVPPIDHALLQNVHKLFRYNLNFNSIVSSPTMCAMRVYELQALGVGIISNYAKSVFNNFPSIRIIPHMQDLRLDFERDESWEEYLTKLQYIRSMYNDKTCFDIAGKMLEKIGYALKSDKAKTIAVLCIDETPSIIESFNRQSYPHKILITDSQISDWRKIKELHNICYFCWFSPDNNYGCNYLTDLVNAFKYTNSSYATKGSYYDATGNYHHGLDHEFTELCSGKALSLFSATRFTPLDVANYPGQGSIRLGNGFALGASDLNQPELSKKLVPAKPQISIVIPVYNNGHLLTTKCLPSLLRNQCWKSLEIIIVDDGSNDEHTIECIHNLASMYSNIKFKINHDQASGSASRPRNQGIDIASGRLISFLDPDNEISPQSYDNLLCIYDEVCKQQNQLPDFVSGFHVKVSGNTTTIGNHSGASRVLVVRNFKEHFFIKGIFPVIATQPAVINLDFLRHQKIRFIEGAAGQDTLFGWELISRASLGAFTNQAHLIYYAERNDSITNSVDSGYFGKKLILEVAQASFLREQGLTQYYMSDHFWRFMKGWYLEKLRQVRPHERLMCISFLRAICSLYGVSLDEVMHHESIGLPQASS